MQYIGLDYHKQYTFATLINSETGEMRQARLSNTPESIKSFIKHPEGSHAVIEASRTWPVLYELLRGKVSSIKLAHPLRVKAIASARIKTDKIDSRILAELLSADLIPEAYIRNEDNRRKQAIIRQRVFFVSSRTRVKNRIRVLIDRQPYEVRKTVEGLSDLFGKAGLLWIREVKELSPADRTLLDQMLMLFDNLDILISDSDKLILRLFNVKDFIRICLKNIPQ
ncbi:transposase [candidate division KSB1 bacterium]